MSEPPEELIKLKAYQIWEKRQQTDKKGENPQSDWEKAEQYFKKHRWKVFLWKLARTLSNRPIRKFADFWEKAPIEKFFLEDIKYLLDKSALVSIITVLTEISIIFSLISWTIDREERKTNEIFSTWIIVKEAEGNQSGILRLALERLLKNNFSLVGINLNNTVVLKM